MIKNIQYNGISTTPSDYLAPDGDLAAAFNTIIENGAIYPSPPPHTLFTLPEGLIPLFIHSSPLWKHYIIFDSINSRILWLDHNEEMQSPVSSTLLNHILNTEHPEVIAINAIGNVIIFSTGADTADAFHILLWSSEKKDYINLGDHIPEVNIEFALSKVLGQDYDFTFQIYPETDNQRAYLSNLLIPHPVSNGNTTIHPPSSNETAAINNAVYNGVFAGLNQWIANCNENSSFVFPFFIRYALRLFDGSHVMMSAPILLIPNSKAPRVFNKTTVDDNGFYSVANHISAAVTNITYRIYGDTSKLSLWKDIITHIDFFISPPIYTYDPDPDVSHDRKLTNIHRQSSDTLGFSHSGSPVSSRSISNHHRHHDSLPENADISYDLENVEVPDSPMPSDWRQWYIYQKTDVMIEQEITSQPNFYKISSIKIEDIVTMKFFAPIQIVDKALEAIQQLPRLDDDFLSHQKLLPDVLHAYNSRLNIAAVSIIPFSGFQFREAVQFSSGTSCPTSIFIHLKKDLTSFWVQTNDLSPILVSFDDEDHPVVSNFPRWLFYPDPDAFEIIIKVPQGYWKMALSSHDFLYGAYWFRGLDDSMPDFIPEDIPVDILLSVSSSVRIKRLNKVFTSLPDNPFYFPATHSVSVGDSRVVALSSAARPLSQGQFGQFPLYAFTSLGIWALQIADNGVILARQPITRDVCSCSKGICPIDNAVIFPADRGLMMLQGSSSKCISSSLENPPSFNINPQSPLAIAISRITGLNHDLIEIPSFTEILSDCRIAYDYPRQRLIVFSQSSPFAFIYSLLSSTWSTFHSRFRTILNAYPETLITAFDNANDTCLSVTTMQSQRDCDPNVKIPFFFISRPLKLDYPDVYKTIQTIIQRGVFPRDAEIASVLIASRDLNSWLPVASSDSHCIDRISGSPYPYFRIALFGKLPPMSAISGCSCDFDFRIRNRLR